MIRNLTVLRSVVRRAIIGSVSAVLFSILALMVSSPALAVTYPVDGNNDFRANVIRRYDNGVLLASIANTANTNASLTRPASYAIDGGRGATQWNLSGGASDPAASGTLQITLDQSYSIGRIYSIYHDPQYLPASYQMSLSNTGFGSLTTVATNFAPAKVNNDIITPFTAKYLQYQWNGGGGIQPYVLLSELEAFSDAGGPLMNSQGGWNVVALQTSAPIAVTNVTAPGPGQWLDGVTNVADLNHDDPSYLRGNGGAGNPKFVMDLGSIHMLESATMGFYHGQSWGNGTQVELSRDGINYTSVYNSITDTTDKLDIVFTPQSARYIRVTDKGSATGALTEFQVFADALPVLAETPLSGSTVDAGTAKGGETVTLANAFTLTNTGELTSELLVQSFTITGVDAAIFDVPDFIPTTLTAGGTNSVQFDLSATLAGVGVFNNAVLTFQTNVGDIFFNLQATGLPVPEPSSFLLLGLGALGLVRRARGRKENV